MWAITISSALVILVIFFLLYFNKEIRALINRIKMIGYGKTRIETVQPEQKPAETGEDVTERLMRALDSPVLKETEDWVRSSLEKAGIDKNTDKEKILFRFLAATELENRFLRTDSLIWGSQIAILETMNSQRLTGLSREALREFYDNASVQYPGTYTRYSFDQYINFLKTSGLISEVNNMFHITILGVEFLGWLTRQGKSLGRLRPL
jgi:hypothetical protein